MKWKQIEGYNYEVSTAGKVRHINNHEELEQYVDIRGEKRRWGPYPKVKVPFEETCHFKEVFKLVAHVFLEKIDPDKRLIDHIDRDKCNSHVDNLRWVTHRQNSRNMNMNSRNRSGCTGVVRTGSTWRSYIVDTDGNTRTSSHKTKQDAVLHRRQQERLYGYTSETFDQCIKREMNEMLKLHHKLNARGNLLDKQMSDLIKTT